MLLVSQVMIEPRGPAYAQVVVASHADDHGKVIAEKRIARKGRSDQALHDEASDVAAVMFEAESQRRRQVELF